MLVKLVQPEKAPALIVSIRRGTVMLVKLLQYAKEQFEKYDNIDSKRMYITHSGVSDERIALVRKFVEETGIFKEIYISRASCTISTHCGPGTLGVLFLEK